MRASEDEIKAINDDRRAIYGPPKIHFGREARMQAIIDECPDPLARQALRHIGDKVCRLIQTPKHSDSWKDIKGYANTGLEVTSD